MQIKLPDLLSQARLIPVITLDDPDAAAPLAGALVAGGLTVLEVTLRRPHAPQVISAIIEAVPAATVGAGTLIEPGQVAEVRRAGAAFGVSPGATEVLLDAAAAAGLPFLPGAATPSEVLALRQRGCRLQKLFPASAVGGPAMLRSLAAVMPDVQFCPTGGIDGVNAARYLACPNVIAVAGSWLAPPNLIAKRDWGGIERLAVAALADIDARGPE